MKKTVRCNERVQVPVSRINDMLETLSRVNKILNGCPNRPMFQAIMDDLTIALTDIQKSGVSVLTKDMKGTITSGIEGIRKEICIAAYEYYSTNALEITTEVQKLFREIVEVVKLGGLQC